MPTVLSLIEYQYVVSDTDIQGKYDFGKDGHCNIDLSTYFSSVIV